MDSYQFLCLACFHPWIENLSSKRPLCYQGWPKKWDIIEMGEGNERGGSLSKGKPYSSKQNVVREPQGKTKSTFTLLRWDPEKKWEANHIWDGISQKELIKCRIIKDIKPAINYAHFTGNQQRRHIAVTACTSKQGPAKHQWHHQCRTHHIWWVTKKPSF